VKGGGEGTCIHPQVDAHNGASGRDEGWSEGRRRREGRGGNTTDTMTSSKGYHEC